MTEEKKYTRSVSQMKQVTKCGESFALSRGFRGPRPPARPWAQTAGGIAFHEMLLRWEKSGRSIDPYTTFDEEWEKALDDHLGKQPNRDLWMAPPGTKYPKTTIKAVYKRFVEKDIPNYITRCEEAEWEIYRLEDGELALELPFEVQLGEVKVRGQIDRIQWWPELGLISSEDTKTGSPKDEDDPRQLGLYRFGAMEQYGIDLTHSRYWYTKVDRGSEWVDLTRFTKAELAKDYAKLDRIIQEDLLLPNPGEQCKVCDVRPYCSLMGWLKPGEELVL